MQAIDDEPLARSVVLTGKAIRAFFEDGLTQAGASLATWLVLSGIDRGRWDSQAHLARALEIEGATLTRHLDRMEREGLIVRTRDDVDRRQIRAGFTPKGRALHRRLRATVHGLAEGVCDGISQTDQAALKRSLARIRSNMGGARADERTA